MHILVVNDDGPPSNHHSPYIKTMVATLQEHGHVVSVVLPDRQRSWIGKAHLYGETVTPSYYRPESGLVDGKPFPRPLKKDEPGEEWVLVDSTPAACVHLGLCHFYQDRGPVDLVLSGPNYGRNTSNLFQLASGTIGGAMEAVHFRKRAIALSFAYSKNDSKDNLQPSINAASRHAVKIIDHLYQNWGSDVELYTVNVPVKEDVEQKKTLFTYSFVNYWEKSAFDDQIQDPTNPMIADLSLSDITNGSEHSNQTGNAVSTHSRHVHRQFKFKPKLGYTLDAAEKSEPGNDGHTVAHEMSSITPLRASFTLAKSHDMGEVKLSSLIHTNPCAPKFQAYVSYEDEFVQPLILSALSASFPKQFYNLLSRPLLDQEPPSLPYLQISAYESISHQDLFECPSSYFANSYIIRKALIRKHYLGHTIDSYLAKNPKSLLKTHVPQTLPLELDYAEFLDEALLEAYELHASWTRNIKAPSSEKEWWVLKPSMSDKGQGIRLFSSEDELRAIFEEWEEADDDGSDRSSKSEEPLSAQRPESVTDTDLVGGMTSQLRHFVVQPYIAPLLFTSLEKRKFHIRTYVLCIGTLRVYVYREMLALFAESPYEPPGSGIVKDMRAHLTNTGLQKGDTTSSVRRFWDLPAALPKHEDSESDWKLQAFEQIKTLTSELFTAAAAQPTNFQPLPNAFELFGIDWLVDAHGDAWLLEVNAFPDFAQTGDQLQGVVASLWKGTLELVVHNFFGIQTDGVNTDLKQVLDLYLGR